MQSETLIGAEEFCLSHGIELSVVLLLNESGLVAATAVEEKLFIPQDQLSRLERLVRIYVDLQISVEGIQTIGHLLDRIELLEQENTRLNNSLIFYRGS